MKYNLRICDGQHVIQESGMVVVGMSKKDVLDILGQDTRFPKTLQEVRIAFHIAGVNQHISALVKTDEVVVDDPIAEIVKHVKLFIWN